MKRKDIINLIIFVVIFAFAAYRYSKQTYITQRSEFVMDTLVEIKIETKSKNTEETLESAINLIQDLENKLSFYKQGSNIWNFNNSVTDSLIIDDDLAEIFAVSKELYKKTNSHYDITVGALTEIWDFDNKLIPTKIKIEESRSTTGHNKLTIQNNYLHKPIGMKINLGSLAKGYIIDVLVDHLKQQNVISGFVNAGGDMRIFGREKPYKIGIQHPRSESNEMIDILDVGNMSVVTSGDYERYFMQDGRRYHHILDPISGYPSENAISVTVIAETALLADAYSTALFLLEPKDAIELAEQNNVEAIIYFIITDEIEKLETQGMRNYYERQN